MKADGTYFFIVFNYFIECASFDYIEWRMQVYFFKLILWQLNMNERKLILDKCKEAGKNDILSNEFSLDIDIFKVKVP